MRLGFFTVNDGADLILQDLSTRLLSEGLNVQGAVQVNTDRGADCTCDMDLIVLGDPAPPVRISQSLGNGASGCRLDAGALEHVAARVAARLAKGADLLLLAKFGKQEIAGHGFRQVIAQALDGDVPVILHVAPEMRAAFAEFAGDMAEEVNPDALPRWCRQAASRAAA